MEGEQVGSYRITGTLGAGGMGAIYTAEHVLIGRRAAVKMLLPSLSSNREVVQRFFDEARATATIRHPGIVEIFDFGYHPSGRAFLVMELLDGESLGDRLARERVLDETEAVVLARSVLGALAAAHARGIVHRDLKPDNVFLVRDPDVPGGVRPKLLDFGIAKLADRATSAAATRTGVVMGTPRYMSPEQCRGSGDVDARADLYSLGCMLYEMVAGRPPFLAEGAGELLAAHLMLAPDAPRAHAPALSAATEAVIVRLLAKAAAERYATAGDAIVALGGALEPDDARRSRAHAVAAAPTTLSSAAANAAVAPPRPRRRGVVVALAGVISAVVAFVLVRALVGGGGTLAAPAREPSPPLAALAPAPAPAIVVPPDASIDAPIDAAIDASIDAPIAARGVDARPRPPRPPPPSPATSPTLPSLPPDLE